MPAPANMVPNSTRTALDGVPVAIFGPYRPGFRYHVGILLSYVDGSTRWNAAGTARSITSARAVQSRVINRRNRSIQAPR